MSSHTIFSVLPLLLLSGCSGPTPFFSVDPAFIPYRNEFVNYATQYNKVNNSQTISIMFADLPADQLSKEVGVCISGFTDGNHIQIDKITWSSLNDWERRSLIFHEMGHCCLGRVHRTDTALNFYLGSYAPVSIMYPYLENDLNNFDVTTMVDELFTVYP